MNILEISKSSSAKTEFSFFSVFFSSVFVFFRVFFQYTRRCRFWFFKISRYRFRFSVYSALAHASEVWKTFVSVWLDRQLGRVCHHHCMNSLTLYFQTSTGNFSFSTSIPTEVTCLLCFGLHFMLYCFVFLRLKLLIFFY